MSKTMNFLSAGLLLAPGVAWFAGECDCAPSPVEGQTVSGSWVEINNESAGGALLEFTITEDVVGKCKNEEECFPIERLCEWDFDIRIFSWDPAANLAGASYEGHTEPVSGLLLRS